MAGRPDQTIPRLPDDLIPLDTVEVDDDAEVEGVELAAVTLAEDDPVDVTIRSSRLAGVTLTGASLNAAHDRVDRGEWGVRLRDHVDLPLPAVDPLQGQTIPRRVHDEPRYGCPRISRRVGLSGAFTFGRYLLVDGVSGVNIHVGVVVLRLECFLLR